MSPSSAVSARTPSSVTEFLFIRHGEAFVNVNDLAFGNRESPLTANGVNQVLALEEELAPYKALPAAVSTYRRAKETAAVAGFTYPAVDRLLDESELDPAIFDWSDINQPMDKHVQERWIPLETLWRASTIVNRIQLGDHPYRVNFTHGLFIAGILMVCEIAGIETNYPFDPVRGYVPLRAQIVRIEIPVHDPPE